MTKIGETKFGIDNVDEEYIQGKINIVPPLRDPKVGLFVDTSTEQLKEATK